MILFVFLLGGCLSRGVGRDLETRVPRTRFPSILQRVLMSRASVSYFSISVYVYISCGGN